LYCICDVAVQVKSIEDVLSLGQELQVKVMGHDQRGNLQISHKALTATPERADAEPPAEDSAPSKPYQATNARFRQPDRARDQRQQQRRVPQSS